MRDNAVMPASALPKCVRNVRWRVAGVTLGAALLRLFSLGRESLWRDEGTSIFLATLPWKDLGRVLTLERANMALYLLLLRFWSGVASDEFTLRLLSAIPGVASIPLIYVLGARWFDRRTGVIASLVLALSAIHVQYSQELRAYSMMLMLLILSAIYLDRVAKEGRRRDWVAHVLTSVLAIYCSTTALLLLVPLWMTVPLAGGRLGRSLVGAVLSVVLLAAPLVSIAILRDRTLFLSPPTGGSIAAYAAMVFSVSSGRILALACVVPGAIVLRHALRKGPDARRLISTVVLLVAPLLTLLLLGSRFPHVPRYLLCVLVPLAILVGYGIGRIPRPWLRGAFLALFVALALRATIRSGYVEKPDWRGAEAYVMGAARPGDGFAFFSAQGVHPFLHYARGARDRIHLLIPHDAKWWTRDMSPDPQLLVRLSPEHARIWLVLSAQEWGRETYANRLEKAILRTHHPADDREFRGITVRLYERR